MHVTSSLDIFYSIHVVYYLSIPIDSYYFRCEVTREVIACALERLITFRIQNYVSLCPSSSFKSLTNLRKKTSRHFAPGFQSFFGKHSRASFQKITAFFLHRVAPEQQRSPPTHIVRFTYARARAVGGGTRRPSWARKRWRRREGQVRGRKEGRKEGRWFRGPLAHLKVRSPGLKYVGAAGSGVHSLPHTHLIEAVERQQHVCVVDRDG